MCMWLLAALHYTVQTRSATPALVATNDTRYTERMQTSEVACRISRPMMSVNAPTQKVF